MTRGYPSEGILMTTDEPHRRQPTDEEKHAAAGAEDYLGVPISDEELADVWTSTPEENRSDVHEPDP
jgi:hypothetical protein